MKEIELVIENPTGLHARPAKVLVNLAKQFQSDVWLVFGEKRANAKSMVSILTLGASRGSQITVRVSGEDEDKALAEIEAAFQSGLGEGHAQLAAEPAQPVQQVTAPTPSSLPMQETADGVIRGIAGAPGIVVGPVFLYGHPDTDLDDAQSAKISLREALDCARVQLNDLCVQMKTRRLAAEAAIFEAHIELMDDPDLADAVRARVGAGDLPTLAWKAAVEERAAAIAALPDTLLAARADDMRDVGTARAAADAGPER